jgi:hypothetical protein
VRIKILRGDSIRTSAPFPYPDANPQDYFVVMFEFKPEDDDILAMAITEDGERSYIMPFARDELNQLRNEIEGVL